MSDLARRLDLATTLRTSRVLYGTHTESEDVARLILRSEWLAERDAQQRRDAAAQALRETADEWVDGGHVTTDKLRRVLLDRAAALDAPGDEYRFPTQFAECTVPRCHGAPRPCFPWCKCQCHSGPTP